MVILQAEIRDAGDNPLALAKQALSGLISLLEHYDDPGDNVRRAT